MIPAAPLNRSTRMQQRSEAARIALRLVAQGRCVEPGRYVALRNAGYVEQRGRGPRARRWLTEAGERFLAEAEA